MAAPTLLIAASSRDLMLRSLYLKSLRDRAALTLLTGLGLGLMGVWIGQLYLSMAEGLSEMVAQLPGATTQIFGDFGTPAGFINAEVYSIFAPGILIYVAIICATRSFAGEEEDHTLDLLAANPLSRRRILLDKAAAMATQVAVVAATTGLGVYLGIVVADLPISSGNVLAVTLNFWLLGTFFGAVAMLMSVLTGRRMLSLVVTALLAMIIYLWGAVLPLAESLVGVARFSPWDWYFGSDPLTNGFDALGAGLLLIGTVFIGAIALAVFERRDLPG